MAMRYLILNNNMIKNDSDICSVCLRTNLYEVIKNNNKINSKEKKLESKIKSIIVDDDEDDD